MTKPNYTPLRTAAEYRWTGPKVAAFLRALSTTGSVAAAAARVGMSRQSAYRLRARHGAEFAQVWDEGLAFFPVLQRMRHDERSRGKGTGKVTGKVPREVPREVPLAGQGDGQGDRSGAR